VKETSDAARSEFVRDESGTASWFGPALPEVYSVSFQAGEVGRYVGSQGHREVVAEKPFVGLALHAAGSRPQVVSVRVEQPAVRVRSFVFPRREPDELFVDEPGRFGRSFRFGPTGDGSAAAGHAGRRSLPVRLRPPGDVIKLSDRLLLVLQPPVDYLVDELLLPTRPFSYQFEGVGFLFCRDAAVLADEMGLGKTMQAITAIRLLRREGQLRRVLLVCPKALVRNWEREFDFWAPELSVVAVEGSPAERRARWLAENVVVRIANYEVLVRDRQLLAPESESRSPPVEFDLVVLDEAQRIKNAASITHKAACSLVRRRSWALTGTPVENSTDDLAGIFAFVAPGLVRAGMRPRAIAHAVSDYILRRTKEQVLADLPPKLFRDEQLVLTPQQQQSYDAAEREGVLRLAGMGQTVSIRHVFELLIRLKQICNFDPATGASAKLERLEAELEEVAASGRKAVVFSQWVETLEELSRRLARFNPLQYHGRIKPRDREAIIARFRHRRDCHVLLISYGAGGVGLNLQFAGYVFLFDRWWNPAVEDQAINRLHRIGAQGPVTVTRFLTLGTIEERIDQILQEKRELFHAVLCEAAAGSRIGLSHEELFGLFGLAVPGRQSRAA